ncbi:hypothetical protein pkur_cds_393 [Pandoravirus kuranda]|uniref:Uncharacterized protein n=1 Tax=Pandoravirus kuranda TaxID=3019033 RepID=A0AA95EGN8_9VIRU|nr:hypothetical protein pkur_cds_393 [Pandoravirus kuranda]
MDTNTANPNVMSDEGDKVKDAGDPQDYKVDETAVSRKRKIGVLANSGPEKHINADDTSGTDDTSDEDEPSDCYDEVDEELIQLSMRRAAKADEKEKTFSEWRNGEWIEVPNSHGYPPVRGRYTSTEGSPLSSEASAALPGIPSTFDPDPVRRVSQVRLEFIFKPTQLETP